jgi:hypothetical protein
MYFDSPEKADLFHTGFAQFAAALPFEAAQMFHGFYLEPTLTDADKDVLNAAGAAAMTQDIEDGRTDWLNFYTWPIGGSHVIREDTPVLMQKSAAWLLLDPLKKLMALKGGKGLYHASRMASFIDTVRDNEDEDLKYECRTIYQELQPLYDADFKAHPERYKATSKKRDPLFMAKMEHYVGFEKEVQKPPRADEIPGLVHEGAFLTSWLMKSHPQVSASSFLSASPYCKALDMAAATAEFVIQHTDDEKIKTQALENAAQIMHGFNTIAMDGRMDKAYRLSKFIRNHIDGKNPTHAQFVKDCDAVEQCTAGWLDTFMSEVVQPI